jgi:hypothetical protein
MEWTHSRMNKERIPKTVLIMEVKRKMPKMEPEIKMGTEG